VSLVVGLSGSAGGSGSGYWGPFSVLEEAREEHLPVQVLQESLAVVSQLGQCRSSSKDLVCDEVRRVICSPDE
jgi:hypothetical protein